MMAIVNWIYLLFIRMNLNKECTMEVFFGGIENNSVDIDRTSPMEFRFDVLGDFQLVDYFFETIPTTLE